LRRRGGFVTFSDKKSIPVFQDVAFTSAKRSMNGHARLPIATAGVGRRQTPAAPQMQSWQ
jgi:hypothetical protein